MEEDEHVPPHSSVVVRANRSTFSREKTFLLREEVKGGREYARVAAMHL